MYTMEEVFMIKDLYKDGVTVTAISEILKCSRTTVYKYLEGFPEPKERAKRSSKLDPYKPYVLKRVLEDGVTNCVVFINERNTRNGLYRRFNHLKRFYVQPYRESPRKQAQLDWIHLGRHDINGKRRQLYGFLMTLSYSRMRYLEITTSMDLKTLLRVHMNAFRYFNGIPKTLVYDNMKTVVQRRLANEVILTKQFADFRVVSRNLCFYPIKGLSH